MQFRSYKRTTITPGLTLDRSTRGQSIRAFRSWRADASAGPFHISNPTLGWNTEELSASSAHGQAFRNAITKKVIWLNAVLSDPVFTAPTLKDPRRELKSSLLTAAIAVLTADGPLTSSKLLLLNDLADTLAPDLQLTLTTADLERSDVRAMLLDTMRETYANVYATNRQLVFKGVIPELVRALRAYDSTGGTAYSEDLRAMYFQFASALATYDGPPTSGELQVLWAISNALRGC